MLIRGKREWTRLETRMGQQPEQLQRGRTFEARVKVDWALTAEGKLENEKTIDLLDGLTKTGRGSAAAWISL